MQATIGEEKPIPTTFEGMEASIRQVNRWTIKNSSPFIHREVKII